MKQRVVFLLVLIFAAQLAGSAPAPAALGSGCHSVTAGWEYDVCFTQPEWKGLEAPYRTRDGEIRKKLVALIGSAKEGDSIRVALLSLTLGDIIDALRLARAEGVDVRIVLEQKEGADTQKSLLMLKESPGTRAGTPFVEGTGKGGYVLCDNGCTWATDSDALQHNKLFLFDIKPQDGGPVSQRTIVTGSMNMTGSGESQYNDMIFITGTTEPMGPYNHYLEYWKVLQAAPQRQKDNLPLWGSWSENDKANFYSKDYIRTEFFGRENPHKSILDNLNKIEACDASQGNKVYVAASYFSEAGTYGRETRARLDELRKAPFNCDVRVLVKTVAQECFLQREDGAVNLPDDRVRTAVVVGDTTDEVALHHKFMAIKAKYAGIYRSLAFTGSHNVTVRSLRRSDENMIRIGVEGVYQAYADRFTSLNASASNTTC